MINSTLAKLTVVSLFLIFAALMLAGYWVWWPTTIMTVVNPDKIATDKLVYFKGERVVYTLDYCKNRLVPGLVSRALVDGIRITYEHVTSNLPVGCKKILVYDLVIPDFTPEGIYHIEGTGEYQVNPLRTERNMWKTNTFQVVNPPPLGSNERIVEDLKKIKTYVESLSNKVQENTQELSDRKRLNPSLKTGKN